MKTTITGTLIVGALAGLIAGCSSTPAPTAPTTADGVKCGGINSCGKQGACAGDGHGCAGQNACKSKGWVKVPTAADCTGKGGKVL
jgi:uncharacterized membrane protein